jgi:YD repeat-containing protein
MGSSRRTVQYRYDSRRNKSVMIDADGGWFSYSYDAVNRLMRVINPQGERTTYTYDAGRRRTLTKLANGPVRVAPTPKGKTVWGTGLTHRIWRCERP